MTTSDDPTTWNESNCYYDSCMSGNNDDWYDCMDALDITISATNTLNEVNHNADQCGLTYTPDFVDSSMDWPILILSCTAISLPEEALHAALSIWFWI